MTDRADTTGQLIALIEALARELRPERSDIEVKLESVLDKDLGIDSLGKVELLSRVERHFACRLPEETFAVVETAQDLLDALTKASGKTPVSTRAPTTEEWRRETDTVFTAPVEAETLVDVLQWHEKHHPDRVHIRFYSDEDDGDVMRYRELMLEAGAVSDGLQAEGLVPGDRVLIMLPTGRDYFNAFFGVLLAGGIPVPIYPPARRGQLEDHIQRQSGIVQNARPSVLITDEVARAMARVLMSRVETLKAISTVAELQGNAGAFVRAQPLATDTAFLQYTSGSTGNPKGVVLSHANLLANIRADGAAVEATERDVFVSWLPLYHDMGLIGAWFGALYFGVELVIMSPMVFLGRPARWLRAIERYGGTLSAAPNFAYELCVNNIRDKDLKGLDLSSWRVAMNGAEAVNANTVGRFIERFSPYGFDAKAMSPVYGLAECSVGLAFPPLGRGPVIERLERETLATRGVASLAGPNDADPVQVVACGQSLPDHEIRIADEFGKELPDRQLGRIQFKGPSATTGYYRNESATRTLFQGEWLNTGDIGYMADRELFVTGRIKEMIIRAGRNIFPEEIEAAISEVPKIRRGRVAVFGSEDKKSGTERLVVVAETRISDETERSALVQTINDIVIGLTDLPPDDVVLAPPGTVLKTSSGKLRRNDCRDVYERGAIGVAREAHWRRTIALVLAGFKPLIRRGVFGLKTYTYAGWCWVVFGVLAVVAALSVMVLPVMSWRWRIIRLCAKSLASLTFTRLDVEGLDNIPRSEPCILVANHESYLDGYLMIATLPIEFSFVAKAELKEQPIVGAFLRRIGVVFVERFDTKAAASSVNEALAALESGQSLFFFPEGTFTRMPGLLPFKMGAFTAAVQSGSPIVPAAIEGTREKLRDQTWLPRRGSLYVVIGDALRMAVEKDNESNWQSAIALRDESRRRLDLLLSDQSAAPD